jgi:hypothetical protein
MSPFFRVGPVGCQWRGYCIADGTHGGGGPGLHRSSRRTTRMMVKPPLSEKVGVGEPVAAPGLSARCGPGRSGSGSRSALIVADGGLGWAWPTCSTRTASGSEWVPHHPSRCTRRRDQRIQVGCASLTRGCRSGERCASARCGTTGVTGGEVRAGREGGQARSCVRAGGHAYVWACVRTCVRVCVWA